MEALIPVEVIEQRILLIRGQKVILDADLAKLYGVPTRVLNQAVRRNLKRFPQDFMFKLSQPEKDQVITICDHLRNLKYGLPLEPLGIPTFLEIEQPFEVLSILFRCMKAMNRPR